MFPQRNGAMKLMGREVFVISTDLEERMNVPIGVHELKKELKPFSVFGGVCSRNATEQWS